MFGLFKKERPVQGLTGMGGGAGGYLVGGGGIESNGPFTISGGTVLTPGNGYKYHVFIAPGNLTATPGPGCPGTIDMLIVAGGGSGGKSSPGEPCGPAGAGGGGIVYASSYQLVSHVSESQNFPVTVGQGTPINSTNDSNGVKGNPSIIDLSVFAGPAISNLPLQAMGGGYGTFWAGPTGKGGPGGCGGGGSGNNPGGDLEAPPNGPNYPNCPGTVTIYGVAGHQNSTQYGAGGGGSGAGSAGEAPSTDGTNYGGDGGDGQAIPAFPGPIIAPAVPNPAPFITAVTPTGIYSGGGGGTKYNKSPSYDDGTGGAGGGGPALLGGAPGANGVAYTGSGGAGAPANPPVPYFGKGGAGGAGIVVIRY